jgi:stringent starvation protein B
LTFRGVPHRCIVPWTSVFAVVGEDGRGLVWGEDVPVEIAHEYARDARATTSTKPEKTERPARPRKTEEPREPPEPTDPTQPTKPRRGHLKLV